MAGMPDSEYSFSLTTFAPNGKLAQIEAALAAVEKGNDSLGIKCTDGVILATEKRLHTSLMDEECYRKIENLGSGVGCVFAGISPDYRVLVRQGRKRAQAYKGMYGDEIPCSQITKGLADVMQEYTQSGGVRPFGVSLLVAGYDQDQPQLFQVDPSGTYFGWKATAIGKNYKSMKAFLERRYSEDLNIESGIGVALLTLRDCAEGKLTEENVEISIVQNKVDEKTGEMKTEFRLLTPQEVKDYLEDTE